MPGWALPVLDLAYVDQLHFLPERTDDSIDGLDELVFVSFFPPLQCWAVQIRLCLYVVPDRALSVVELAHVDELQCVPERADDSIDGLHQRIGVPGSTMCCWAVHVRLCLYVVPDRALPVFELAHVDELQCVPERTNDSIDGLDEHIGVPVQALPSSSSSPSFSTTTVLAAPELQLLRLSFSFSFVILRTWMSPL
eukprot:COSAG01_NODE_12973_length_1655_cov_1.755784_1_plen_194_part_10